MKSKNNPENRNKNDKRYCPNCNEVKKPILIAGGGIKQKMCTECKCGIIDKNGLKVR